MIAVVTASLLAAIPAARRAASPSPALQAGPANQLTDEEVEQRVNALLGNIDTRVPADDFRSLGPRGRAALERIAQDPKVLPSRRTVAVAGLSAVGDPASSTVLLGLARSEDVPVAVRLSAVHSTPNVIPATQLTTVLKPVLQSAANPHVRRAAAEVLSRHGGCALVRAQAQREDDRGRMQRALERCANQ
jgi:HEAT repeat protein